MVDIFEMTIPKLTGDEPRKIYVYLPDYYDEDDDMRYPVLYMFDGHNIFFDEEATYGKSWGLKKYMDESGIPMIIVGIDCNHHEDNGRLSEYSPFDFTDRDLGSFKGKGKKTMNWIVHTLKPMIDRELKTLPGRKYTFIAGSSMGGLMSIYALLQFNRYFSKAAALSPSLWVNPSKLESLIKKAHLKPNSVLYMDYGSREFDNHDNMVDYYSEITSELMNKGIFVTSRIVPRGTHTEESWEKQIPFFMNTLLYDIIH